MKAPTAMSKYAVALSLLAIQTLAQAGNPPALDVSKLNETSVQMVDQSRAGVAGKTFEAGTIINATTQKLCATIQNYADYPSFMPNTAKASASKQGDDATLVEMTLHLPLGKVKKYRLKMSPSLRAGSCSLTWKLVPWEGLKPDETILDTVGYWELTPLAGNANKTIVKYHVFTDPGPVPLGFGWIVDSLSKDSIPKMLDALRSKVR